MVKKTVLAALVVCIAGSSFVFAGTPVVNRRERRIYRGVKSGRLTRTSKLKQETGDVDRRKRDLRKEPTDGAVLTGELRGLPDRDPNKTGREIPREKPDGDAAVPAGDPQ